MPNYRINKVLIANRGEIALRIQRACNKLNIPCAITVSEADKNLFFAKSANEISFIAGSLAKDSYLNVNSIIEAAKKSGCDAVHPGYGFLSENFEFAMKVIEAGLVFIGPSPECIKALGDKGKAREVATKCKVPITQGSASNLNDEELHATAKKIGYPLLIKAVAGGGGRGMRVVRDKDQLIEALPQARSESKKFFADDRVYLEKFIEKPRHVEVQIVADNFSNVIHFGTRDCSTQRRYQKLIEEAPAPNLKSALREKIHSAAIKIAKAVNYNSVGTAEFLVSGDKFYFLEMNTRIQVEHPVTEEITGKDLVEIQIRSARNEKLSLTQSKVKFKGHSIEFRINAENVGQKFSPITGQISSLPTPDIKYLRQESGFAAGDSLSPYYDSLIAKLIVTGDDREDALSKSRKLFQTFNIEGISTTIPFHKWILERKEFLTSPLDITFIEREFSAQSLSEQEARSLKDPKHKTAQDSNDYSEIVAYNSEKFSYNYKIEVIHLPDGTFVLIPHNKKGVRAKEEFCRRSNGYEDAFRSLREEVLDKVGPARI